MVDVKDDKSKDRRGAAEGATSVAEAVKRVADASVSAVLQQGETRAGDFSFDGSPGGTFLIRGEGLGTSGTVKLNGVQLETVAWSTQGVGGKLPAGATSGDVELHVDDEIVLKGTFGSPKGEGEVPPAHVVKQQAAAKDQSKDPAKRPSEPAGGVAPGGPAAAKPK